MGNKLASSVSPKSEADEELVKQLSAALLADQSQLADFDSGAESKNKHKPRSEAIGELFELNSVSTTDAVRAITCLDDAQTIV